MKNLLFILIIAMGFTSCKKDVCICDATTYRDGVVSTKEIRTNNADVKELGSDGASKWCDEYDNYHTGPDTAITTGEVIEIMYSNCHMDKESR